MLSAPLNRVSLVEPLEDNKMRKCIVTVVFVLVCHAMAFGESRRTLYTYENKTPEKGEVEIGALGWYREVADERASVDIGRDEYTLEPYLRYGLLKDFNVTAKFPYMYIDPKASDNEQGPGDVELGAELVAFQDIFGYPFILPHVAVRLPTGDEDKGIGEGNTRTTCGVSVGTRIYDALQFVVDASYTIYRDEENETLLGGSVVWDVDERLSLLGEVRTSNKEVGLEANRPVYYLGGMCYRATDALQITVYGGGAQHAETDVLAGAKVAFSF
jgi:hypothetical protein